jgi:hypothetical protein
MHKDSWELVLASLQLVQQGAHGAIVRRQAERGLNRRQGFKEIALLPQSTCQSHIRVHLLWGELGSFGKGANRIAESLNL